MKIICTKEALLTGVNTVQRAVSSKSTMAVLQGILIKAEKQSIIFSATDLEIGIRCEVPAEIISEGSIVIASRLFGDIVRKLPDTMITLELIDNIMNIKYYQSNITLNTFDPEEFPLLPDLYENENIPLSIVFFKNMIKQVVFACAADESRPVFTGTLLNIEGNNIQLVATDTHRLAYRIAEIPSNEQIKFSGIIPAKTMTELNRLLKEEDEILNIYFTETQIMFKFGAVYLISRLIEGQFPNYKQVIPKNCETKVYTNTKIFLEAVERASLLSRDANTGNIIRLSIEEMQIKIDQTSEVGKISEQIDLKMEGKEVIISFNAKFLLDALKIIDSEEILIELSGAFGPGVIRPLNDNNYLYLVLPVRTF